MNFSNRPWQMVTVILIVLGILALSLGGYLNTISQTLLSPILSAQNWLTTRYQVIQDILTSPEEVAALNARNAELEAEVAELQTQVINLRQQVTEVEILSALLDFARAQPQNEYRAAVVIAIDPRPFLQYVIINRGSDEGFRRGMPIVSAEGLIGRIAAVTSNAARVELITDPASTVNVRILPAETDAVLKGSITSDLFVDLIPQDSNIQPGDLVLTSGLGGNYPPNILVGQIASVRKQATELFQEASIQSVVDFSRIEIVLVIVNFQPVDITPLIPEEIAP